MYAYIHIYMKACIHLQSRPRTRRYAPTNQVVELDAPPPGVKTYILYTPHVPLIHNFLHTEKVALQKLTLDELRIALSCPGRRESGVCRLVLPAGLDPIRT